MKMILAAGLVTFLSTAEKGSLFCSGCRLLSSVSVRLFFMRHFLSVTFWTSSRPTYFNPCLFLTPGIYTTCTNVFLWLFSVLEKYALLTRSQFPSPHRNYSGRTFLHLLIFLRHWEWRTGAIIIIIIIFGLMVQFSPLSQDFSTWGQCRHVAFPACFYSLFSNPGIFTSWVCLKIVILIIMCIFIQHRRWNSCTRCFHI